MTGGTGFLGSLMLRRLKDKASVTVLTRDPEGFLKRRPELNWPELSFCVGDIRGFTLDPTAKYDFVVHGGNPADLPRDPEGQAGFRRTAIEGTIHLLEQVGKLSEPPRRVLLLSSGAVYGNQPEDVIRSSEDRPTVPSDTYGEVKLESERLVTEFCRARKIGLGIARVFSCAGPYIPLAGRFALGQFIASAWERGEIRILSDGTPKRSYLEGDELAEWLLALTFGKQENETAREVYNIGSDDAISIRKVAEIVAQVFSGHQKKVVISVADTSSSPSPSYVPDIRSFTNRYGRVPKKSSTQAVREATEWSLGNLSTGSTKSPL